MKPKILATLVSGVFLIFVNPVLGQQYEVIYPNDLTAIAEKPLPSPVFLSQQNILRIKGEFFPKGRSSEQYLTVQGSGFIEKNSGYIVSTRHLLVEEIVNLLEKYGEPFYTDKNGIPHGNNYDYIFFAILDTATSRTEYPLEVIAMGPWDTYLDVIVFKPLKKISAKGLILSNNIEPGKKVYASGFTAQSTHYHKINGRTVWIVTDEIKFTSEHIVLVSLQNKTIKSFGINKLYRLSGQTQFGFSGGPVFNSSGQVIGIMIEKDTLFSFVLSSVDIATVLQSIK